MKALLKDPFVWLMGLVVAGAWMLAGMPGWQENESQGAKGEVVILDPGRVMEAMKEKAENPDEVTSEAVARRLKVITEQLTDKGYIVIDSGVVFGAPEASFVEVER